MQNWIRMMSHPFYNSLLSTLPEAVTVVNREGMVLNWNRAAESLYGIAQKDIVGKPIGEFFQRGSLMLLQVMESGLPVYGVYHQPTPDKHVYINTVPVTDDSGTLIGAISVEQDITDVVRLNEERFHQQDLNLNDDWQPVFDTGNRAFKETLSFIDKIQTLEPMSRLLFIGENGVGKSILARLLHAQSRLSGHFVSLDCRATSDGLLHIELFGHGAGFFERVSTQKQGKLELAAQGTLYLRNVDHMSIRTQVKLAQAMQDGGFLKGGEEFVPISCRIIASATTVATQAAHLNPPEQYQPLHAGMEAELHYLFHEVKVPTIRSRREDIPAICYFYLVQASKRLGRPVPSLRPEVTAALAAYDWPGNLPEVKKAMEHIVIAAEDAEVSLETMPEEIRPTTIKELTDASMTLGSLSQELERQRIERAISQTGGNKAKAARLLGISRGALYYKLRQYGMAGD